MESYVTANRPCTPTPSLQSLRNNRCKTISIKYGAVSECQRHVEITKGYDNNEMAGLLFSLTKNTFDNPTEVST